MNGKVKEIFIMRAFACSAVVLLHSIAVIQDLYQLSPLANSSFRVLQLLLLFSTPMFVFISEFVLSYSYGATLPEGFFPKRLKMIMVPYIFFGCFYALVWSYGFSVSDMNTILNQMFLFVFRGDYHGYFVLIIFQYYLLHKLCASFLNRLPVKITLLSSFIFNIAYLIFFNYTLWSDYAHIPYARYFWTRGYYMIFPAWIFYFTLAYYAGTNMKFFRGLTHQLKWLLFPLLLGTGSLIIFQYKKELLTIISTRRPDIVPYTLSIILFVFFMASFIRKIPTAIDVISRCSYGIYLMHPFIQQVLQNILMRYWSIGNPFIAFIIVFMVSLYVPILIAILLNKTTYGYLFVGKLGPSGIEKSLGPKPVSRKLYENYGKRLLKEDMPSKLLVKKQSTTSKE